MKLRRLRLKQKKELKALEAVKESERIDEEMKLRLSQLKK